MKLLLLTGNDIRHRYVANELGKVADEMLIVSECKSIAYKPESPDDFQAKHFLERRATEASFFEGNDSFLYPTLPVVHREANSENIYQNLKKYNPDLVLVYGSSIIREPLLSLPPKGRFVNMHLGISPYYRGSGTNFWPFVNDELEYVGATLLHIDAGVDTGDILAHVIPDIKAGDSVHTVGCKVIRSGTEKLKEIVAAVKAGKTLNRVKQWKCENPKYYRKKDFTEDIYLKYHENMKAGMVEKFASLSRPEIRLIETIV